MFIFSMQRALGKKRRLYFGSLNNCIAFEDGFFKTADEETAKKIANHPSFGKADQYTGVRLVKFPEGKDQYYLRGEEPPKVEKPSKADLLAKAQAEREALLDKLCGKYSKDDKKDFIRLAEEKYKIMNIPGNIGERTLFGKLLDAGHEFNFEEGQ